MKIYSIGTSVRAAMLLFGFAFLCVNNLTAQGRPANNDANYLQAGWQLGVDLLPLINKNTLPSSTLMARKVYAVSDNRAKALRFGVGFDMELREYIGVDTVFTDKLQTYAPYISIGHEWIRSKGRYSMIYGTEVFASHYRKTGVYRSNIMGYYIEQKDKTFEVGIHVIAGLQYTASNSLTFRIESAASSWYSYKHNVIYQALMGEPIDYTKFGNEIDKKVFTKIRPLYQFSITYSLNYTQ